MLRCLALAFGLLCAGIFALARADGLTTLGVGGGPGTLVPYLVTGQICSFYNGVSNVSCSLPNPVAGGAGDLVVVYADSFGGGPPVSVTDDKSDTCTVVDTDNNWDGIGADFADYHCGPLTAGAQTFTVTVPSATIIWVEEYRNATGTLDGHTIHTQSAPGTGTNAVTTGNITTAFDGDLIVSGLAQTTGSKTANPGTGFTVANTNLSENLPVQSTHGAIAGTWTQTGTGSTVTLAAIMAFKHE